MHDCREDRLDHRADLDAAKARIQQAYEYTPPHSPQPKPAPEKPEVAQLTEALTRLAGIGERTKADPGHPVPQQSRCGLHYHPRAFPQRQRLNGGI